MINVGIVGSPSAIRRHANALGNIPDIRIAGTWITGGIQESVQDAGSGIATSDPDVILEKTDALIITDAGNYCNRLTTAALRNARHVFLYPAVVGSVSEVYQLIQLAREANVILKCGRTGNAGSRALLDAIPDVSSISMIELQHYTQITGTDRVPAIANALLSDMEILSNLVHARIISIKAKGLCMLSSQPEILNARLEFDNGCAVNYNSNLIAAQNEFFITIVAKNKILKYNFISGEYTGWHLHRTDNYNESPIFIESILVEQKDSLSNELAEFISLIRKGPAFLSINDNGFESFVLTDRILEKVMKTLVQCA